MAGLGVVTVRSGGRTYRCKHGRKRRARLFCSKLKPKGAKRRGRKRSATRKAKTKLLYGAARTAQLRKAYAGRGAFPFGPGMSRRRGPCRDAKGRSGMMNKKGQCKVPKRGKR